MNRFVTFSFSRRLAIPLCAALAVVCSSASAEKCYVWKDENGVKHFGSAPPANITAKTVACHNQSDVTQKNAASKDIQKIQEQAKAARVAQCKEEGQRLATLKTSGTRIRMMGEDGKARYLTPEELKQEIEFSENFLSSNCKGVQ